MSIEIKDKPDTKPHPITEIARHDRELEAARQRAEVILRKALPVIGTERIIIDLIIFGDSDQSPAAQSFAELVKLRHTLLIIEFCRIYEKLAYLNSGLDEATLITVTWKIFKDLVDKKRVSFLSDYLKEFYDVTLTALSFSDNDHPDPSKTILACHQKVLDTLDHQEQSKKISKSLGFMRWRATTQALSSLVASLRFRVATKVFAKKHNYQSPKIPDQPIKHPIMVIASTSFGITCAAIGAVLRFTQPQEITYTHSNPLNLATSVPPHTPITQPTQPIISSVEQSPVCIQTPVSLVRSLPRRHIRLCGIKETICLDTYKRALGPLNRAISSQLRDRTHPQTFTVEAQIDRLGSKVEVQVNDAGLSSQRLMVSITICTISNRALPK